MRDKRKISYAQALALQKAQAAAARKRREDAEAPCQSEADKAAWDAAYEEALRKYREAKKGRES